jgi:hypothetical protein
MKGELRESLELHIIGTLISLGHPWTLSSADKLLESLHTSDYCFVNGEKTI